MNLSSFLYVQRWLVRDTFRQAAATRLFWIMLAISALCTVFCLSVDVESGLSPRQPGDFELYSKDNKPLGTPERGAGELTLMFGLFTARIGRHADDAIHFLQVVLGNWVAGTAGLLLTLVWTAGFLPEFLQPSSASVLFAKPVPRWVLLLGKYLGVVTFVTFQTTVFFVGTWLALGLKTGIWLHAYLLGIPLLVLNFAVLYSFSLLLAACTRSTVAAMFGSVLFWLMCFGINYGRFAVLALPELAPGAGSLSPLTTLFVELGYWGLPKPADVVLMLEQALESGRHFSGLSDLPEFRYGLSHDCFYPELSLLSSFAFTAAMLAVAGAAAADDRLLRAAWPDALAAGSELTRPPT